MVNAVLGVTVYAQNSRRRMMFSSFDPDVCAALRLRQQRIPVSNKPWSSCTCSLALIELGFKSCHPCFMPTAPFNPSCLCRDAEVQGQ